MRSIEEIAIKGCSPIAYKDASLGSDLAVYVRYVLKSTPAGSTVGTGALIGQLLPGHTPDQYRGLANVLTILRKQPTEASLWAYTGKKNRFGKPALHWLAQATTTATRSPEGKIETPRERAERLAALVPDTLEDGIDDLMSDPLDKGPNAQ